MAFLAASTALATKSSTLSSLGFDFVPVALTMAGLCNIKIENKLPNFVLPYELRCKTVIVF